MLQIFVFSIIFFMLFVLLQLRNGLLDNWRDELPPETPNHFVFNIFDFEKKGVDEFFSKYSIDRNPFYPLIRGRVKSVNGEEREERIKESKNKMNYQRELNLTWASKLGEDNILVDGAWWSAGEKKLLVSAEQEYAEGLGIGVGDTLVFSVAGLEFSAVVASLREVKWDSMNPNFFMIFNRELDSSLGVNWLTSFYVPEDKKPVVTQLIDQFPTVSIIELDQTLEQLRSIVAQVSSAIEFILWVALLSASLVMLASVQASIDERLRAGALLRSFGADRRFIRRSQLCEFLGLGLISGVLALCAAEATLYFIEVQLFDFSPRVHVWMWLWGLSLSAAIVGGVGWISTRKITSQSPLKILREV